MAIYESLESISSNIYGIRRSVVVRVVLPVIRVAERAGEKILSFKSGGGLLGGIVVNCPMPSQKSLS